MDTIPLSMPILMDGATGTELRRLGMPDGACTEQWVLEHPQALLEVQRRYVQAGSRILLAPTFGANRASLERRGIMGQVREYNQRLVEFTRQAAGDGVLVAGDMAPAGLTVVIVKKELAGRELPYTPLMLGYKTMIDKDSMYNTPPCWCIYMLGLVLEWLEGQGGVPGMEAVKHGKAAMLYDAIDSSRLFTCAVEKGSRSDMNVVFRTGSDELDAKFVKESTAAGFTNLKGHRSVGGMRASIYNAMPVEGVEKLCEFIKAFDKNN